MIYSGDVRPFGADVVFMRLRRNRPCTLRGKISFCWCSSPAPRTEASGGQGASPLEPDKGLSHPSTTRRRLPRPGTHGQSLRALDDAQEAFMPLHPDGGGYPLDPAAGYVRQKGDALER